MTRDKVRGMLLGVGIGDSLGMPVEMKSPEYIKEKYGRIETYQSAAGHKWFDGRPTGSWTDDTVLSLAVARGIIESGNLDMDAQVKYHVEALSDDRGGWGKTTKEALERLKAGVHWTESGKTTEPNRGTGNGVAMKVAPVAVYLLAAKIPWGEAIIPLAQLAHMTHATAIGVSSCLAQVYGVARCLHEMPDTFNVDRFIGAVKTMSEYGRPYKTPEETDDISDRFKLLYDHKKYTAEQINEELRGGCYAYESLPFSYMYFVKNPWNISCLYDVVNGGRDADSNASMVGALLGALHGTSIFPDHLVDGLQDREMIEGVADALCDKLAII